MTRNLLKLQITHCEIYTVHEHAKSESTVNKLASCYFLKTASNDGEMNGDCDRNSNFSN